jgi:CheY-like chemotaxis protein
MATQILLVVDDLFFLARIQQTARQLGVEVQPVAPAQLKEELTGQAASAIFLDLNHCSGAAIQTIQTLKQDPSTSAAPVIAFLSHVQGDLARAARAAGCDVVLARSAFSKQLPELLRRYAGKGN